MQRRPAEVLGVVPARGGSKGLPRKNLRALRGRPLVAYPIAAGLGSTRVTRLVVSTDDEEIAAAARLHGAEVPFPRPAELAQDDTPTLAVIQHLLRELEAREGYRPDAVAILQPTAPLTTSRHVDEALALLDDQEVDSAVSVCLIPGHFHPEWSHRIAEGRLRAYLEGTPPATRRQALPPAYYRNGSIYAPRARTVQAGSLYGAQVAPYVMPPEVSANIDDELDLAWAELLLARGERRT